MNKNIISSLILVAAFFIGAVGCKKDKYSFGELKAPSGLALTTAIVGVDATNPNGNGTGNVTVTASATDVLSYNIDFGDGKGVQVIPSGVINYKYTTPGTNDYTITVNAIGRGGATSTISKKIKVFVAFEIPAAIIQSLTNGSSRTWVTDKAEVGHFGVGPANGFTPSYYAAPPNTREACAYDDEITFSKDALNRISMTVDNKGQSFSIGAASAFYGMSGGDNCYGFSTGGTKMLAFMDATTGSTSAVSTRIQFTVPGNGIINFGTGGTTYEILSATATTLHLRNIGADGNSWYQKLKVK
ncbi:MAG TPA: PKD domain-containing protein [Flavisolibacter sp.]|nr:PKD domain-containing protein [Flavisolibacter sp.]